jgi:dTDP-4-amino-4,6-dideoxygalactose transaminase
MIPLSNPQVENLHHKEKIIQIFDEVLMSGEYILGSNVEKFEKSFSNYLSGGYAVGCNSGTDAIVLALKSLSIGKGHKVLVPSMTATATVTAIKTAGAEPLFCEINQNTGLIELAKIDPEVAKKATALVLVHLYGQSINMDEANLFCKNHQLLLIEDCAQAAGAEYLGTKLGTFGDCGCFSFYPTKNLGAIGDGGLCVAKSSEVANKIRELRQYGWNDQRVSVSLGINSRLDEFHAAILDFKLQFLDINNQKRRDIAQQYKEAFKNTPISVVENVRNSLHVYHLFVIRCKNRDGLRKYLTDNGVVTGIHYQSPTHLMPSFSDQSRLAETEIFCNEIISLPMYPDILEREVDFVISKVLSYFSGN